MPVEVTWWGHATCTVEDSDTRVITDPLFARRLAHLRRRRGEVPPAEARRADVAVVSHLHADHLHVPSLALLAPGTRLLVPRGAPQAVPGLRRLGHLHLREMAPGDEDTVGDLRVRAVPARHDGRRLPLLAVIATAAPLMGLLGTVVGMVKTFTLITVFGTGNAAKLSTGISEVLVATELGLAVAIPSLVIHGFLAHRIHKNLTVLERHALEFLTAAEVAKLDRPASDEDPALVR